MRDFMLGLVVGGFLVSFVGAAGTSAWAKLELALGRRWSDRRERRAVQRKHARETAEAIAKDQAVIAERATLQAQRVGASYRKRYTADDEGTIVTVIELGDRDWRRHVLVEEIAPAGRPPTKFDSPHQRINIEWAALNRSHDEQRHMTAHYVDSFDDDDGWIEFERIAKPAIEERSVDGRSGEAASAQMVRRA